MARGGAGKVEDRGHRGAKGRRKPCWQQPEGGGGGMLLLLWLFLPPPLHSGAQRPRPTGCRCVEAHAAPSIVCLLHCGHSFPPVVHRAPHSPLAPPPSLLPCWLLAFSPQELRDKSFKIVDGVRDVAVDTADLAASGVKRVAGVAYDGVGAVLGIATGAASGNVRRVSDLGHDAFDLVAGGAEGARDAVSSVAHNAAKATSDAAREVQVRSRAGRAGGAGVWVGWVWCGGCARWGGGRGPSRHRSCQWCGQQHPWAAGAAR